MKFKIMLILGLTTISLTACQSVSNISNTKNVNSKAVQNPKNKTQEKTNTVTTEKTTDVTQAKSQNISTGSTVKSESGQSAANSNNTDLKNKAEEIISSYFNAISNGDVKTLNTLCPSATEENSQLKVLYDTSKVSAEIQNIQQISLSNQIAVYKVDVKLYTKVKDNNFTDNKSQYLLQLDMTKGIIASKAIVSTTYIE